MKICEYYERLISDSLDRELTEVERAELDAHLVACTACGQFAERLAEIRVELQALPLVVTDKTAPISANSRSFLTRLWNTRLTVPLPVAAGILLMLLSAILLSALTRKGEGPAPEPVGSPQATYVQIEVVPPASAKPLERGTKRNGE